MACNHSADGDAVRRVEAADPDLVESLVQSVLRNLDNQAGQDCGSPSANKGRQRCMVSTTRRIEDSMDESTQEDAHRQSVAFP